MSSNNNPAACGPAAPDETAILIFETASGSVEHRFCTEALGRELLLRAHSKGRRSTMFVGEGFAAEMVYATSRDLRDRVDAAKAQMLGDIRLRAALDRQGVPCGHALRNAIHAAVRQLQVLAPTLPD